jgi:hypothetical protein
MEYKVWIEIEEYDPDTEEGTSCDPGFSSTATFDTYELAVAFAQRLHEYRWEVLNMP